MISVKNSQFFSDGFRNDKPILIPNEDEGFEEVFYVLLLDEFDGGARLRVRIDALREVLLQSLVLFRRLNRTRILDHPIQVRRFYGRNRL